MSYAIIRNENHKVGAVPLLERHNERLNKNYSNKDIDINRSSENYYLKKIQAESYLQEFESIRTRQELKGNLRLQGKKQSTVLCEFVITSDKEFFDRLGGERTKKFFEDAYDFVTAKVGGEQYILSAVVHMDEKTPHMHLSFCPITPEGKLSAKAFLGNQKSLSEWQTAYHERMSSRWNELERGQSSMITGRKHIPTWLFKLGGRLDKQYEEIVKALSDINAFNAGKKRDKALELLSAWLPDVEKFSREISKQSEYIQSLKAQIGQEADYAERMRDGKYAEELKVREANRKILELQRTNSQMERLLKKIPPEILEEIQKSGRNKSRER